MKRQLLILSHKKSIATTTVHVVFEKWKVIFMLQQLTSAYISQARMCMPIPYM
jgi:hypothetical protein